MLAIHSGRKAVEVLLQKGADIQAKSEVILWQLGTLVPSGSNDIIWCWILVSVGGLDCAHVSG